VGAAEAKAQGAKGGPNTPPAIRKALDEKITLDFNGGSLEDVLDHLSQKTKLKFVVDYFVVQQMGINFGGFGIAGPGGAVGGFFPGNAGNGPGAPAVAGAPGGAGQAGLLLKIDNGKVRTALQSMLKPYNLTFVILGDSVVITTDEVGHMRQMRQRVNIDVKGQTLADALQKLADDTGVNLLIDPRQADKAKAKINLQLEDVTVETAFRLLTELADLGSASMGNVLFVTSESRADKLRKENSSNAQGSPFFGFPGGLPPLGGGRGIGIGAMTAPGIAVPDGPVQAPPPPKK
jgi:hypothetical protein